jgi:ParB-like chromosome segregation protein Spo0J
MSELLTAHPIANEFPEFEREDYEALKADIKANGQQVPIELYKGQILDGRNRYRACTELGIAPQLRAYDGTDPLGHSVSLNLMRRHLSHQQRSVLAYKLQPLFQAAAAERKAATLVAPGKGAALQKGQTVRAAVPPPLNQDLIGKSRDQAAKAVHVSGRSVSDVAYVAKNAPDLIPKLQANTITVTQAATQARAIERAAVQEKRDAAKSETQIAKEQQAEEQRKEAAETWERLNRVLDAIYGLQQMLPARAAELTPSNARARAIKKSNDLIVWLKTFVDTLEKRP